MQREKLTKKYYTVCTLKYRKTPKNSKHPKIAVIIEKVEQCGSTIE